MTSRGRKGPGGSGDLQNRTDPLPAGWVGSIPTRSRHGRYAAASGGPQHVKAGSRRATLGGVGSRRAQAAHRSILAKVLLLTVSVAMTPVLGARAQQPDSARAGIRREQAPPPTTTPSPPLGPRVQGQLVAPPPKPTGPPVSAKSAFLYSLLLPGLGQAKLDRSYAAGLFFTVEAVSFEMARQALVDLKYAQAHAHDSTLIVQTYQTDSLGQALHDSAGHPIPATYAYARYDTARIGARKTHLEDWIAVIVFNHILSAADAFVAAELWDLPAHVHPMTGQSPDGRQQLYGLAVTW